MVRMKLIYVSMCATLREEQTKALTQARVVEINEEVTGFARLPKLSSQLLNNAV